MSNQIVISSGAKVRSLEGVLTGTAGIVNSVPLGGANGVATLDSMGKVPLSQLPASVVTYLGTWNAATNTPTLTNGVGDVGDLYICNVAGTVNFGAGPITFAVGDWVIYNGSQWQKSAGASGTVTSVAVTESGDALTITGSPITTSGTINIGFAGTGSQYIKGDGTLATFPTTIDQAKRLITEVYNSTGATLSKGTVVYINGGQGNLPTVTKAQANADNTSAQTYGVVQSDITNMNNGFVVVFGSLTDIDTQAYAVGTQLYLSGTTAGAWTSTKPSAPIHLVYVGIVVRSHPTQGVVEIRIQNGYELEELHDVAISAPVNNQGIFYNSSNDLWENKSIATALGYTPANDALVVHLAGTETITGVKNFDIGLTLRDGYYPTPANGYIGLASNGSGLTILTKPSATVYNHNLQFQASSNDYNFPAITGVMAMLEGTQTFSGAKTFSALTAFTFLNGTRMDYGLYLSKGSVPSAFSGSTVNLYSDSGNNNLVVRDNSNTSLLQFQAASSYTYTFPAASGTLALTSNLSSYVPYTGATTNVDLGSNFLKARTFYSEGSGGGGSYAIKNGTTPSFEDGYTILSSNDYRLNIVSTVSAATKAVYFGFSGVTATRTYTLPDASGTLALTSNLSSYVPYTGATGAVDLGNYDLTVYGIKVGRGAGSISTNIVLGASALSSNTTGSINTSIGTGSLQANTTGSANTAIGNVTLNSNLTGQNNTAIGNTALSMTTSSYNTGIGAGSLANNTSGSYNTGLGYGSGSSITTGSYNVIIGSYTGTSGMSNNIVLSDGQGNIRYQWDGTDNILTGRLKASSNILVEGGSILLKQGVATTSGSGYLSLSGSTGTGTGVIVIGLGNGATSSLAFPNGSNYSYTYPASTGTLVLGTGTTNYLAKFTSSAVIGNSLIYDNGTNVGIGTATPFAIADTNLTVNGTTSSAIQLGFNGTRYGQFYTDSGEIRLSAVANLPLTFYSNNLERMRITSSGDVGIGTSTIYYASTNRRVLEINGTSSSLFAFKVGDTQKSYLFQNGSDFIITNLATAGGYLAFENNGAERMRITSDGKSLFGTSTSGYGLFSTQRVTINPISDGVVVGPLPQNNSAYTTQGSDNSGTRYALYIANGSSSAVGNISFTSSSTSYNTSSDYRLKQDLKNFDGLSILSNVKTYDFEWKIDNTRMYGVIAHELQEILPYAVQGEKDGKDMQGVDYSKLVPILVKAIQEQQAQIEELKALINK